LKQERLQAQCQRIAGGEERALFLGLGQAGRKLGRAVLPSGWSADQAARTLLVLALPSQDPTRWLATLDRCFHAGTVEELIAHYQALPLLRWVLQRLRNHQRQILPGDALRAAAAATA
jgi:hypothetical protein